VGSRPHKKKRKTNKQIGREDMKSSTDRIITTHAGSLPRPPELLKLVRAKIAGQPYDQEALAAEVTRSVEAATKAQADLGLDIVSDGDGEMSKPSFLGYITERLGGVRVTAEPFGNPWKGSRENNSFNIMLGKPRSISIRQAAPSVSFAMDRLAIRGSGRSLPISQPSRRDWQR
jgi:hypothetical protein